MKRITTDFPPLPEILMHGKYNVSARLRSVMGRADAEHEWRLAWWECSGDAVAVAARLNDLVMRQGPRYRTSDASSRANAGADWLIDAEASISPDDAADPDPRDDLRRACGETLRPAVADALADLLGGVGRESIAAEAMRLRGQGLTHSQAAERLGVAPTAIYTAIARGRTYLVAALAEASADMLGAGELLGPLRAALELDPEVLS